MGFIDGLQVMFGTKEVESGAKDYSAQRQEMARTRVEEMKHENKQLKKRLDTLEQQLTEAEQQMKPAEPVVETAQNASQRDNIDQLIVGVTIQVQEMIDALDKQMEQLEQKVSLQVRRIGESSEKQLAAFRVATDQLDGIQEQVVQIEDIKTATGQLEGISAQTAQIASIKEATDQINEIRISLLQLDELKETVRQYDELKEALAGLKNDLLPASELRQLLNSLRTDLTEKIHTEDVKCYRNIKSLMNELGSKMDDVELSDVTMKKLQKQNTGWKAFSLLAFLEGAAIIAYIVYSMGWIPFLR